MSHSRHRRSPRRTDRALSYVHLRSGERSRRDQSCNVQCSRFALHTSAGSIHSRDGSVRGMSHSGAGRVASPRLGVGRSGVSIRYPAYRRIFRFRGGHQRASITKQDSATKPPGCLRPAEGVHAARLPPRPIPERPRPEKAARRPRTIVPCVCGPLARWSSLQVTGTVGLRLDATTHEGRPPSLAIRTRKPAIRVANPGTGFRLPAEAA
jgi:hypothetical protein